MAGFWDRILGRNIPHTVNTPRVTYLGSPLELNGMLDPESWNATYMWRNQPHLRTVVSFRARNIAQLGLHVFRRVSDTDRERDTDSVLARALRRPDQMSTYYDLMFALVVDLDLYDRAYWVVTADSSSGEPVLRRLPPAWVSPKWRNPWEVESYEVSMGDRVVTMQPENVVAFGGYSPDAVHGCSSTVEALKQTLKEQLEAAGYRMQVWKRGGRVSSVITRPVDAGDWSREAQQRFADNWRENFTDKGPNAGGTPILPDGMDVKSLDFNAREQQFVEAQRLHLQTVASAYHVNPVMVGDTSGSNYSNVREFRKMLYGDSLGPTLAQIENAVNTFLVPAMGLDPAEYYAEFNVQEKLQGNFEEQAQVMQTMTGRPIMTLNEARSRFNLPGIDEEYAEQVITPLNVTEGGQASPTDSGSQNRTTGENNDLESRSAGSVRVKAAEPADHADKLKELFARTFARQREAVKSRLGAKDDAWWDADRWDRELSEDLMRASTDITMEAATRVLSEIGEPPTRYNVERTRAYLEKRSEGSAHDINEVTREAIAGVLSDGGSVEEIDHYFDTAEDSRADAAAMGAAAALVGFASVEAVKQTRPRARKRWKTNSSNPRESHAAMNGETVGIDENFSNNLPWPGGIGAGADEVAGCQCSLVILPD